MGGRFSEDGEPLDVELLDMAKKRMISVYTKKHRNDPLARRREYQKAWEETTGAKLGVSPGTGGPWIVWYADNIAYQPLYLTTTAKFMQDDRAMDFEGGGIDPSVELKKVYALGPFPTRKAAITDIWKNMHNIRNLGGIYYYVRVADFKGKMHNINHLGLDQ